MFENGAWIFLLEAGVALSLLLVIVWATWPKGKSGNQGAAQDDKAKQESTHEQR